MIVCIVKERTSLATIAMRYGFTDWRPIWNYNTKVKRNLHSDQPDAPIAPGTKIVIPLTADKYEHVIGTIESTKKLVQEDTHLALRQLQEAKIAADRFGAGVDFVSEIAMIFCGSGSGMNALRYTGIVRRQQIELTALNILQKTTGFLGHYDEEGVEGIVADKAGEALAKQALKKRASTLARGTARDFGSGIAEEAVKYWLGEVGGFVATGILEGWEAALKAVRPSSLAQYYLKRTTGESPEETYKGAISVLRATSNNSLNRLNKSVERLRNESELVYGRGAQVTVTARGVSGSW